jgi:hypothetical protein
MFKVTIYDPKVSKFSNLFEMGDVVIYTGNTFHLMLNVKLTIVNYNNDAWFGDGRIFYYKDKNPNE